MRLVAGLVVAAACAAPQRSGEPGKQNDNANLATGATLAVDEDDHPSYSAAELERALTAERAAEASAEQRLADAQGSGRDDDVMTGDLAVRRRFIAALETCQSSHHLCPPRLDDPVSTWDLEAPPPLDAPLRFDLDSWRKVADELHGRACACRTLACIDTMDATIDLLEARPMRDVAGDDSASASITGARECLFRLRGRR